ncbi:MAG: glycosyltransferase family 4 protein [Methylobacter sp.]
MPKNSLHMLYFTAEQWPTFRPDVAALFGKYLPRYRVTCDLVTEHHLDEKNKPHTPWGGGDAVLCEVPRNRAGQYLVKFWHNLRVLAAMDAKKYDAIQVRDMSLTALAGLIIARLKGVQFFYWLSYPHSEGQIESAKTRGIGGGLRFWFLLGQGTLGMWLLYRIVLPRADHVFVQSRQMQLDVARHGIAMTKMTPVPMGVDMETVNPEAIQRIEDRQFEGKRVVAYLGTLGQLRRIEVLFQMLAKIRERIPNIMLALVGDSEDAAHRVWLEQEAVRLGVDANVLWTGWLPNTDAWSYMRAAEIGLSPIPRGYLLDMGSPTKAVEYMALGLPVVGNDNPDQMEIIEESGAGKCVPLQGEALAEVVVELLEDQVLMRRMGVRGREYVAGKRAYDSIAGALAEVYLKLGAPPLEA